MGKHEKPKPTPKQKEEGKKFAKGLIEDLGKKTKEDKEKKEGDKK